MIQLASLFHRPRAPFSTTSWILTPGVIFGTSSPILGAFGSKVAWSDLTLPSLAASAVPSFRLPTPSDPPAAIAPASLVHDRGFTVRPASKPIVSFKQCLPASCRCRHAPMTCDSSSHVRRVEFRVERRTRPLTEPSSEAEATQGSNPSSTCLPCRSSPGWRRCHRSGS